MFCTNDGFRIQILGFSVKYLRFLNINGARSTQKKRFSYSLRQFCQVLGGLVVPNYIAHMPISLIYWSNLMSDLFSVVDTIVEYCRCNCQDMLAEITSNTWSTQKKTHTKHSKVLIRPLYVYFPNSG